MSAIKPRSKLIRGFTIVELLVVIVVIAILAAISIVAYNGMKERADTAKTASAVHAYLQALELFKSEKGHYPNATDITGLQFYTCLGEDYLSDRCWDMSTNYQENAAFNTVLKSYLGKLPMPFIANNGMNGVVYVAAGHYPANGVWTFDNKPSNYLVYAMDSRTKCPVGPVASLNISTTRFSSTAPSNGQTYTSPPTAYCYIALTD